MGKIKKCAKCNKTKNIVEFHKDRKSSDGCISKCKSCVSAKMKNYYNANKDIINRRALKYRKNNKDKIKVRNKEYYEKNIIDNFLVKNGREPKWGKK